MPAAGAAPGRIHACGIDAGAARDGRRGARRHHACARVGPRAAARQARSRPALKDARRWAGELPGSCAAQHRRERPIVGVVHKCRQRSAPWRLRGAALLAAQRHAAPGRCSPVHRSVARAPRRAKPSSPHALVPRCTADTDARSPAMLCTTESAARSAEGIEVDNGGAARRATTAGTASLNPDPRLTRNVPRGRTVNVAEASTVKAAHLTTGPETPILVSMVDVRSTGA